MTGRPDDGIGAVTKDTTAALPPAESGVAVHLETQGGNPLTAVTKDQSFVVTVDKPRPTTGDPPPTTTVTFRGPDGSPHTLTLQWDGGIKGPVHYRSNPVTIAHGAEGVNTITLPSPVRLPGSNPDQGVEFTVGGGMSGASLPVLGLDVPNGGTLTASSGPNPGSASASMTVYETVDKMVIAFNDDFFSRAYNDTIEAIQRLKKLPDSPAVREARRILDQRYHLLEESRQSMAGATTDIDRAILGATWVQIILAPPNETARRSDYQYRIDAALNSIQVRKEQLLWGFVRDLTIGYYQFVMSQIPLSGSLWSVLFGTDIMGNKLAGWERVVAAFDLAGQVAMVALPVVVNSETNVRGTVGEPRKPSAPVAERGPGALEAPRTVEITKAPAGTRVEWSEDFGLEGRQAQKINLVVEKNAALIGEETGQYRKVYALVRKTGTEALGQASEGHAGKAEPIKSKTNNATDVKGGWGSEAGPVSYYTPDSIAEKFNLKPDDVIKSISDPANPTEVRWVQPDPPSGVDPKVWKRAGQRIREYWDEKPMMDEILTRGLAEVRPDGVIIDRGITNYTLDPETHELVKSFDGPANGTGKPIFGDPDMYGFFFEDGTPLSNEQIARIIKDLGPRWVETEDGWRAEGARVMHPDIFSWDPHEQKNIDIKAAIMGAHEGQLYGWRDTPDGLIPVVGPKSEATEALIMLGGVSEPPRVAYGGVPLPPKTIKGPDFGTAPAVERARGSTNRIAIAVAAAVVALVGIGSLFLLLGPKSTPTANEGVAGGSPSNAATVPAAVATGTPVAEGPVESPAESQQVVLPPSQAPLTDLCGLVTSAKATAILGAPVRLQPAPWYCAVTPTSQSKVGGVIFTNVVLSITERTGAEQFETMLSAAQGLGPVRAVDGLGDKAYDTRSGLLVLKGTTFLQVGRSAIWDPAKLGADAPFPVVRAFAELVLPFLNSPEPNESPSEPPSAPPLPSPTSTHGGGSVDPCQLLGQQSADAIMTTHVLLAPSALRCTIIPTVSPVVIDGVSYFQVVLAVHPSGDRAPGDLAFGVKDGVAIGATANSTAPSDAAHKAALMALCQRLVDATLAGLP